MGLEQVKKQGHGFAVYPFVKMYKYVTKKDKKTKESKETWSFVKQLLFGDYISFELINEDFERLSVKKEKYIKVKSRGEIAYIKESEIQAERILEVNFVDVGQGDGCHVVTPKDEHFIIDAGVGDNMFRFLKWRFNLSKTKIDPPVCKAIITHPDSDHFKGFLEVFTPVEGLSKQLKFDSVYHNGIFEMDNRDEKDKLGKITVKNGKKYIEELFESDESAKEHLSGLEKGTMFENTLKAASVNQNDVKFKALWKEEDRQIFYKDGNLEIEVLGPVPELIDGKKLLRYFSGAGPTKNGHSVVLMLKIGNAKILIGGDLNKEAEEYLLEKYTGVDVGSLNKQLKTEKDKTKIDEINNKLDEVISTARKYFQADVAKACHHGSHIFSKDFLKSINTVATVISSGDEEAYCHPRPDALGTIGKYSRGERPLIFSTELARSSKEFIDLTKLKETKKRERIVTVYGMINLRTDGEKIIVAQKLEKKSATSHWDIHTLEWNKDKKIFEYVFVEKE